MAPDSQVHQEISSEDVRQQEASPRSDFTLLIKAKNAGGFPISTYLVEDVNSTIELVHHTQYSIYIVSNSNYDATAEIHIDSEHIGNFLCQAKKTTKIHRPVGIDQAFVFISQQSSIAARTNTHIDSSSGLVQVIIRPQDPSSIIPTRSVWQPAGVPVETDGCSRRNVSFKGAKSACSSNGHQPRYGVASATNGHQPRYGTACAAGNPGMSTRSATAHNGFSMGDTTPIANSLGATVLGDPTHQTFTRVPQIVTCGLYLYNIQLVVGNPRRNTSYYLAEDDDNNCTSHYQSLRRQNL